MSDDLRRRRGPAAPRRGLARSRQEGSAHAVRPAVHPDEAAHPHDPAEAAARLAVVVRRTIDLLSRRGRPVEPRAVRLAVEQLRHHVHEAPDPAVRAAVHVACSHLSAGSLDDAQEALATAALRGPRPSPPHR